MSPWCACLWLKRRLFTLFQKLPFILVSLALTGGTLQYVIMRRDQAVNLGFGCPLHTVLEGLLHFLRFASGVHLYYALVLFWSVPTCIMLLVGFSMIEFRGVD